MMYKYMLQYSLVAVPQLLSLLTQLVYPSDFSQNKGVLPTPGVRVWRRVDHHLRAARNLFAFAGQTAQV